MSIDAIEPGTINSMETTYIFERQALFWIFLTFRQTRVFVPIEVNQIRLKGRNT